MNLISIQPVAEEADRHYFVATFDSPRGHVQAVMCALSLVSYSHFQNTVLIATGCLWRYSIAEGLPEGAADAIFKEVVDMLLREHWRKALASRAGVN